MGNKDLYNSLCNTEKSLPIFSRDWWLDATCGKANWEVFILQENGFIVASLPIYVPHKGVISMPSFTQTMGPWFAPESEDTKSSRAIEHQHTLCKLLIAEIKAYPHFLQNFNYSITDWLPFYWNGYSQTTKYTYVLNGIDNEDVLLKGMSSNIKRNINRARTQYHISVRKGITTDDFLKVQEMTFKRQNLQIKADLNVLKRLIEVCRERKQGDLWGGYDENGQIHAAAFIVWQESSAWYLAGGNNTELRESGAHSLVLYEGIRYVSHFTKRFDFEGSMLPGVEQFFREFGATQMPYFSISKGKPSLLLRAWMKLGRMLKIDKN